VAEPRRDIVAGQATAHPVQRRRRLLLRAGGGSKVMTRRMWKSALPPMVRAWAARPLFHEVPAGELLHFDGSHVHSLSSRKIGRNEKNIFHLFPFFHPSFFANKFLLVAVAIKNKE
jgi:hypothetical protein